MRRCRLGSKEGNCTEFRHWEKSVYCGVPSLGELSLLESSVTGRTLPIAAHLRSTTYHVEKRPNFGRVAIAGETA